MTRFRVERDSMGELQVPADALWGAQTQRAIDNFPISGLRTAARFHTRARHWSSRRRRSPMPSWDCSTSGSPRRSRSAAAEVAGGEI